MTEGNRGPRRTEPRRDRMAQTRRHDPYRSKTKPKEGTVCDECEAAFFDGRWTWKKPSLTDVHSTLCPACERIRDGYPAGTIELLGDLAGLGIQTEDILGMIRNVEKAEKEEHPLERIMDEKRTEDGIVITTTGIHLGRRVASALKRQLKERVEIEYGEEESRIRVTWKG